MSKTWRGQESVIEIEDTNGNAVPVGILDDPAVTAPAPEAAETPPVRNDRSQKEEGEE